MKYEEKIIENLRDFTAKYEYEDQKLSETCSRAADAIEELQSQLPKWIPVTERLPEEGRYVLVVYETIAGLLCHVSMLWTYATGNYYWDGLHGINPTHWMPLPKPPKEEKDG